MSSVAELYEKMGRATKLSGGFTAKTTGQRIDGTMTPGEIVLGLGIGTTDSKRVFLAVTNRRVIVEKIGPLGKTIEVPITAVTAFTVSGAIGTIQLVGAGYRVQIRSVGQPTANELAAAVRQAQSGSARTQVSATGGPSSQSDPMDALRKLGELRDAGVLTADEFEAKKAELLKRV